MSNYDAILFLSFGGPEGMDDVMPFLANVLRGKNVPEARMKAVAHHYEEFGGVSPINGQNRELIKAMQAELDRREIKLPVYWGNRNWHPMLADTLKQMETDGIKRALTFVTSAYSSYSGCRQYLEDIQKACDSNATDVESNGLENKIVVDKLRVFYNHPDFVQANVEHVASAIAQFSNQEQSDLHIAYTAHSIPNGMAQTCQYQNQLLETCRLVSESSAIATHYKNYNLVFQSRSGPATQPWLEPDILDHIRSLHEAGVKNILVHPIGFVSDHMEVLYDLDTEAKSLAESLGIKFVRSTAAGTNPLFARMMGDLIAERLQSKEGAERKAVGHNPAAPDVCKPDCCAYTPARPPAR